MSATEVTRDEIENRVPHRYENILLDRCIPSTDTDVSGQHMVQLGVGDSYGRDLFLKKLSETKTVLIVPIIAELIALSSIINSGGLKPGEVAFFAAITQFKRTGSLNCEGPLEGAVVKVGDKAGFYRFQGDLRSPGFGEASCQVMAYYTNFDDIVESDDKKVVELPGLDLNEKVTAPEFKDARMFMVDSLRYLDPVGTTIICDYCYPEDHPCIRGHFPDNPVMMGVMQWLILEDAVYVWSQKQMERGHYTVSCQAEILKDDGTLVCEIKQAVLDVYKGVPDVYDQAEIKETKKVVFRDMVKPNQTLRVHVSSIKVSDDTL